MDISAGADISAGVDSGSCQLCLSFLFWDRPGEVLWVGIALALWLLHYHCYFLAGRVERGSMKEGSLQRGEEGVYANEHNPGRVLDKNKVARGPPAMKIRHEPVLGLQLPGC